MSNLEQSRSNHLANIEKRSGKSLEELTDLVHQSGLTKHREIMAMLKGDLGMSHGDSNAVALHVLKADQERAAAALGMPDQDEVSRIYSFWTVCSHKTFKGP